MFGPAVSAGMGAGAASASSLASAMSGGQALSGALSAGGSILGGIMGSRGEGNTAVSMLRFAKRSRHEQRYMARHRFRVGMHDMRRAGLNPILAYQNAGASQPGVVNTPNLPTQDQAVAEGVSTAADKYRNNRLQRMNERAIYEQVANAKMDTRQKNQEIKLKKQMATTEAVKQNMLQAQTAMMHNTATGINYDNTYKRVQHKMWSAAPWLAGMHAMGFDGRMVGNLMGGLTRGVGGHIANRGRKANVYNTNNYIRN